MSTVSIVMPAYNAERYIEESIQSVISQTFEDWELIVVDDASIDSTAEIVQQMSNADARVHFFQNSKNSGVSLTRNRGLELVSSEYIAFLDSDDLWVDNKLELQLKMMTANSIDLCYSSYYFMDTESKPCGVYPVPTKVTYDMLLEENCIGCSTVLLTRACMGDHRFAGDFFHEDYVLWLQLLRGGSSTMGITQPLVGYRVGGRSSNKITSAKNRWAIYRRSEQLPLWKSGYYFVKYSWRGIYKHLRIR